MAAGTSSRFAPLSYETHKSLLTVRGEVLIERQIRQIRDAGIDSVVLVGGYMKERFAYLREFCLISSSARSNVISPRNALTISL